MTHKEAGELVIWLAVSWPNSMKGLTNDQMKAAKTEELLQTFGKYDYKLLMAAFDKWKREHEKYPTAHNILNEIAWMQREQAAKIKEADPDEALGWPMEIVHADGHEACYGIFSRDRFVNHAKNPNHLQPEEWNKRFLKRRQQIYEQLRKERVSE